MASEGGRDTAEAERHCFRSVSERRLWRGGIHFGAYASGSSPHARGACEINRSAIGNRCELGTIETPEQNLTIFSEVFQKPKCGTREVRPNGFRLNPQENPPKMNPNPARKRAEFFRREAGSKSEAILTYSICFEYKKNFCFIFESDILNLR